MGKERADFAAVSALSLPHILTWFGIQHKMIVLPMFAR